MLKNYGLCAWSETWHSLWSFVRQSWYLKVVKVVPYTNSLLRSYLQRSLVSRLQENYNWSEDLHFIHGEHSTFKRSWTEQRVKHCPGHSCRCAGLGAGEKWVVIFSCRHVPYVGGQAGTTFIPLRFCHHFDAYSRRKFPINFSVHQHDRLLMSLHEERVWERECNFSSALAHSRNCHIFYLEIFSFSISLVTILLG